MVDINGVLIEVGQTVKTQQHEGGIFAPAPAKVGEVVLLDRIAETNSRLAIKFYLEGRTFPNYILLDGKINEVIL